GIAATRRLVLLPAPITADMAQTHGIADAVVDDDAVQQAAITWAQDLVRQPARALAWTKRMVNAQPSSLEEALRLEIEAQSDCFGSDEFRAGIAAFRRDA
ncbi:MAG TPA: enoyl-CoA hydratase-related protein, partial [Vineibacter sp.]|nr:enoyl-CoA hydratase-related protein [Vineibacter sp.]